VKFITQEDAVAIAVKLQAEREWGRKHEIARFRHNNKIIFQFGIRHGSRELPHGHIPNQMKISQKECRLFRKCDITLEQYIEILKEKGFISG
jgi:hypothetical protein